MRTFIRFDSQGTILGVAKLDVVPDPAEPWGPMPEGEEMLEVTDTKMLDQLKDVAAHDIAEQYRVDIATKQLVKGV